MEKENLDGEMDLEEEKEVEHYPYATSASLVHFDSILECRHVLTEDVRRKIVQLTQFDEKTRYAFSIFRRS